MKAILEFNLPEEDHEFKDAVHGSDWKHAMWQLDENLRRKIKYDPNESVPGEHRVLESVRDEIRSILSNKSLDLEA